MTRVSEVRAAEFAAKIVPSKLSSAKRARIRNRRRNRERFRLDVKMSAREAATPILGSGLVKRVAGVAHLQHFGMGRSGSGLPFANR